MDKSLIDPPNKPYSPVPFVLQDHEGNDVDMEARWCKHGKMPMLDAEGVLTLLYKGDQVMAHRKLNHINKHCKLIENKWFIEITKLIELLQTKNAIPGTHEFKRDKAKLYRDRIVTILTSSITKARTASVSNAPAVAGASSAFVSDAPAVAGASCVSGASSSSVEKVMPRPLRQKKIATMPTFAITSAQAACNGASHSSVLSAASAASAMQVRLLV